MNHLSILFLMLSFIFGTFSIPELNAQEAQFRIISCRGDVKVRLPDAKELKIYPGDKLQPEGVLLVGQNGYLKLICRDKPHYFDEEGEFKLSELYTSSMQQSMSFTGKFWSFIMEGLKNSDSKEDLVSYHKNYMSVSGGVKGYSNGNDKIRIISPLAGKLSNEGYKVEWSSNNGNPYTISVEDAKTREEIFQVQTSNSKYSINKGDIDWQEGSSYFLKVSDSDGNQAEISFKFQSIQESKIQAKLESLIDYKDSGDLEKKWMRAVVLEMQDYRHEAELTYQGLLSDFPEDKLVKKMYNSFLARTDQLSKLVD